MKTFNQYITEANDKIDRRSTPDQVKDFINAAHSKGTIDKSDWDALKVWLSREVEKIRDRNNNTTLNLLLPMDKDYFKNISSVPNHPIDKLMYSVVPLSKFERYEKLLDAARKHVDESPVAQGVYNGTQKLLYNEWKDHIRKFNELKDMVVTVAQKRAAKKQQEQQTFAGKKDNAKVMVDALMTQINDAKDLAARRAEEYVDKIYEQLADMKWDIGEEMEKGSRRSPLLGVYLRLTSTNRRSQQLNQQMGGRRTLDARFRVKDAAAKKQFIEDAVNAAEADYISFVNKMVEKVDGVVVAASVSGNPWTHSILSVEKSDGTKEKWKTQMIINYSKLGKAFNQFPSRKTTR